jgi:hypothetical protein
VSIAVEDWDDLADEPRRRGRRGRQPEQPQAPAREPEPPPAPIPAYEPTPVQAQSPVRETAPAADPSPAREHPYKAGPLRAPRTESPMRQRIAARAPSAVPPADVVGDWDDLQPAPAPAPEPPPEVDMGVANFADDSYGDTFENLRLPAGIAGANALFWLVGRVFGVVELVGVAFFVSIGLLLAAYVLREWQRDRTALICIAGALPLPLTIISLFL